MNKEMLALVAAGLKASKPPVPIKEQVTKKLAIKKEQWEGAVNLVAYELLCRYKGFKSSEFRAACGYDY